MVAQKRSVASLLLTVALALCTGCGGGGGGGGDGGGGGGENLVPVDAQRDYNVPGLTGAAFNNTALTVRVTNVRGGAIDSPDDVEVTLTSSDGLFNNTPVTVTSVSRNRIEGTVPAPEVRQAGRTCKVVIVFSADGRQVTVTITWPDNSSASGTGGAVGDDTYLPQATQLMNQLLSQIARSETISKAFVRSVETAYRRARNANNNSPEANLGLAVMHLAVTGIDVIENLDITVNELAARGAAGRQAAFVLRTAAAFVNPVGASVEALAKPQDGASGAVMMLQPTRAVPLGRADVDYNDALEQIRTVVLPALNECLGWMAVPVGNETFTYDLTVTDEDDEIHTITLDHTEARLIAAVMRLMAGAAHGALVYNFDWPDAPTITQAEMQDLRLTPAEYLPAAPFGVLNSDGQSHSQQALAALRGAAQDLSNAWTGIQANNEIGGQDLDDLLADVDFENVINDESHDRGRAAADAKQDITTILTELTELLGGVYTPNYTFLSRLGFDVNPATQQVIGQIDVPGFMTNPPADLRAILPTFGGHTFGLGEPQWWYGTRVDEPLGDWPVTNGRVTLGGLLTPGVPLANWQRWVGLIELRLVPDGNAYRIDEVHVFNLEPASGGDDGGGDDFIR